LVLDGQQRLQSLYVAFYGTREGKELYFDVLSGLDSDDMRAERYVFQFMSAQDAKARNERSETEGAKRPEHRPPGFVLQRFEPTRGLLQSGVRERRDYVKQLTQLLNLPEVDQTRLEVNLSNLAESLSNNDNIFRVLTIDENLPHNSPSRKSEADVLEIFVRVNREGTPLSRSDLVFSMLKLNWKESAEALPAFVRNLNEGNSFDLDTDFVIRCLFAVSNLGTKFDLELLRRKSNVARLRSNFDTCCDAIRSTIDFVQRDCWCQSSRLLGGDATLVPFVYYLFHTKNHEVPNKELGRAREALYMFAFAKPFSRYADSRLQAFIREDLRPLVKRADESFPLESAITRVGYWERLRDFGEDLIQSNPPLALHLVQGLSGAKVQYPRNAPEVDHIFPRSVLREKGYDEAEINHFANLWILAKGKNQNKSKKHPKEYFSDVDDGQLRDAMIDREMLDYRRYTTFLESRKDRILEKVKSKVGFRDSDFRTDSKA
jgi:hypothetical protein